MTLFRAWILTKYYICLAAFSNTSFVLNLQIALCSNFCPHHMPLSLIDQEKFFARFEKILEDVYTNLGDLWRIIERSKQNLTRFFTGKIILMT